MVQELYACMMGAAGSEDMTVLDLDTVSCVVIILVVVLSIV